MASSSSRSLLHRLAELARGRIRANHRMLSSTSSSTAAIERASQSPAEAQAVRMTEGCVRVSTNPSAVGGCSCKSSFMVLVNLLLNLPACWWVTSLSSLYLLEAGILSRLGKTSSVKRPNFKLLGQGMTNVQLFSFV
ncbi:uncharacterized protein [Miscanthus floridulus]|uniref:uncharacterized protein n=1 Tax=Miscanthus floridulus TaxID=154761 RepID=UPI0034587D7E